MLRTRLFSALMVLAGLGLAAAPASPNCTANTLGTGNHKVCAVLGNPCESKSGTCITIIIPKENTQGGDCICVQSAPGVPNDSTFLLEPTGPLPGAAGHASVRWFPDGRRAVAIGIRGLIPGGGYRVYAHVGGVGSCAGGTPTAVGAAFVADGLGDAVVIEQTPGLWPYSVRETGGAQRVVLCGAPPLPLGAPGAAPWSVGALALGLAAVAASVLHRRSAIARV